MVTEQQIKDLAYAIWEKEGRPEGKDLEHYFQARQILEERQESSLIELASSTKAKSPQRSQPPQQSSPSVADVQSGQYHHRRFNRR